MNLYSGNIRFIFGAAIDVAEFVCDGADTENMAFISFISDEIELLFDFTCPTELFDHDIGWAKISKKANYIEVDTIKTCELHFDDDGGLTNASVIYVYDNINDDATFKAKDFILVKE
eukprot:152616_1